jgi:GNAT superfamily N-acetyltransferase
VVDVVVVTAEDWRLRRELRRAELLEAPGAFGSTLAEWSGEGDTEARWRARLGDGALNLVLVLDGVPVGMVSALAPSADDTVELISLWIAPAARGRGVGDEAVRRVVAWASDKYPGALTYRDPRSPDVRLTAARRPCPAPGYPEKVGHSASGSYPLPSDRVRRAGLPITSTLSLHCSTEPIPRGRARTAWSVMESSSRVTTSSRTPR